MARRAMLQVEGIRHQKRHAPEYSGGLRAAKGFFLKASSEPPYNPAIRGDPEEIRVWPG
jgi:hypothetical protein